MTHPTHKDCPDLSDGGPYHPHGGFPGISIRTYAAIQIFAATITSGRPVTDPYEVARASFEGADALLSALALHPEDVGGRG